MRVLAVVLVFVRLMAALLGLVVYHLGSGFFKLVGKRPGLRWMLAMIVYILVFVN